MTFPVKTVQIAGKAYTVAGLSDADVYFASVKDDFEPDFRSFCQRFIRPDYVCLDIGANIGMKSLMLAQFVPSGQVVAVEAAPMVGQILEMNVKSSGEQNIAVSRCAISDTDGEVSFDDNSAYGHIAEGGVKVPAKRAATVLSEQGVSRLDFVKIDVEGFEFPILRDALPTINEHRALVLLEFNSWCQMAYAGVAPLEFARWILDNFSHVFMVRRGRPEGEDLQRVLPDQALDLLHANLTQDGCVTDLLVTNAPERLEPSFAYLRHEAERANADRARIAAELSTARSLVEALRQECATAAAQCDELAARLAKTEAGHHALLGSTSWRWTAPVRAVVQKIRRGG